MNALKQLSLIAAVLALGGAGLVLAEGGGPAVEWWVIAGGGGPASGTGVTLNDTVGQPVTGISSAEGASLAAGYWVVCTAAAAVMPVVTVTRDGDDAVLSWDADPANARYQVWVATSPYFDPDAVAPTEVTPNASYPDPGAAASLENHFYIVRGLNACGAASTSSGRVGEFTLGLTPGN